MRLEPLKIIFGWDASIRALPRGHSVRVSRWLRQSVGTEVEVSNLGKENLGRDFSVSPLVMGKRHIQWDSILMGMIATVGDQLAIKGVGAKWIYG